MGDFKGAFIESLGKSLAYALGGLIFLLVLGVLIGAGVYMYKDPILDFVADTIAKKVGERF